MLASSLSHQSNRCRFWRADGRRSRCGVHMISGDVRHASQFCEEDGCGKQASFTPSGAGACSLEGVGEEGHISVVRSGWRMTFSVAALSTERVHATSSAGLARRRVLMAPVAYFVSLGQAPPWQQQPCKLSNRRPGVMSGVRPRRRARHALRQTQAARSRQRRRPVL